MISYKLLLNITLFIVLLLIFTRLSTHDVEINENFVPGKICTDPKSNNYIDPVNKSISDVSDNCTCDYPNNIVCSKYFALNYKTSDYSNDSKRCFDTKAYNFEINDKVKDNSLCQYENNDICYFPISNTHVNSLYDIIDNPDEYLSLHSNDGNINYNNILRSGPCIPKNKNRGPKLELYYRLFNRTAINLSMSQLDPIFNLWDNTGKITYDQLTGQYGKTIRSYNFTEEGLNTNIDVIGYGLNASYDISYSNIVELFNNQPDDKKRHVALAISKNSDKYAIGIGKTLENAMDIAMMNCILYEIPNNDANLNQNIYVDRSYNRTVYQFKKAKMISDDDYKKIKEDISKNIIVSDDTKQLIDYIDKLNESKINTIGILMANNKRYFKYPNDPLILTNCLDSIKNISTMCTDDNKTINGEKNCNEVIMLKYDDKKQKCTVLQNNLNVIKNYEFDFSKTNNLSEINKNTPIKMLNSMYMNYDCNHPNTQCFIYSVNDKRFCKSLN